MFWPGSRVLVIFVFLGFSEVRWAPIVLKMPILGGIYRINKAFVIWPGFRVLVTFGFLGFSEGRWARVVPNLPILGGISLWKNLLGNLARLKGFGSICFLGF